MEDALVQTVRDQIRGISGALLVAGLTFHYTMETWWLGWTLPFHYLVGYAVVGLVVILVITRQVGFHEREQRSRSNPWRRAVVDFAEVLAQSFVASYVILLVLGIVDAASSLNLIVRLGLIEVVPLGFGAALANSLFVGSDEQRTGGNEGEFPRNLAVFSLGALFLASSIAPTQEMELIAVHMNWRRYVSLVALTLLLIYLILYELAFKGHQSRVAQSWQLQVGTTFLAYAVGVSISFFLLLGFGHFDEATPALVYQETLVLAFPASLGAAGAEVLV